MFGIARVGFFLKQGRDNEKKVLCEVGFYPGVSAGSCLGCHKGDDNRFRVGVDIHASVIMPVSFRISARVPKSGSSWHLQIFSIPYVSGLSTLQDFGPSR